MVKIVRLVLVVILSLFACGCISNQVSSLSSFSMETASIPVNPALSRPVGGLHPYVSASYFSKHGFQESSDSIEDISAVTLSTGFNWHKSIEESDLVLPFFGVSLEGNFISYKPEFTEEEWTSIKDQGVDFNKNLFDYSGELGAKVGLLFRYDWLLAALFFQGIVAYEDGSYASLRQDVDGIGSMYNLVNNPWTYGYSFGFDVQGGTVGKWDLGVIASITTVFNETQSVSWDYIEENVNSPFSTGHDPYSSTVFLLSPYFDYRNLRLSVLIKYNFGISAQVSWRF